VGATQFLGGGKPEMKGEVGHVSWEKSGSQSRSFWV